ncbi:hypothetical protein RRG08_059447 [Elysia crispata]|uniref:Uncharacterized protein n=1 Tax=Elysia crispata TaxID=231223 RepID=A0AAE1A3U7_9GAST|nr:hypothetical protein RRG08_059447 [Elysia crispata]
MCLSNVHVVEICMTFWLEVHFFLQDNQFPDVMHVSVATTAAFPEMLRWLMDKTVALKFAAQRPLAAGLEPRRWGQNVPLAGMETNLCDIGSLLLLLPAREILAHHNSCFQGLHPAWRPE